MLKADVSIIGASLSGAFAALLLARNGHQINLVKFSNSSRAKSCGEGLSIMGQRYLEETGLWRGILDRLAYPLFGYEVHCHNGEILQIDNRTPVGYSLQRSELDHTIFNAVKNLPNVKIISDRAHSIERVSTGWRVLTCSGEELVSSELIVASGIQGRFLAGEERNISRDSHRFGITLRCKGRWNKGPSKRVIIQQSDNSQLVLTPISSERINLCVLLSTEKRKASLIAKKTLTKEALFFAAEAGFSVTELEESCAANFVDSSRPDLTLRNLYYVGDAAEIFDPIGGMGMAHSFMSASLAAAAISGAIKVPKTSQKAWMKYARTRNLLASLFRIKTWLSIQLNVRHSAVLKALLKIFPRLTSKILFSIEGLLPTKSLLQRIEIKNSILQEPLPSFFQRDG